MLLDLFNINGEKTGTVEAMDAVFGIEPNQSVLHEVLTAELAAWRQGTAATKTRAMVRGGGRKPFRQKGTGRARQGSTRAPHMVGGGVTFGPQPRSYDKKVNKKVRKLAIKSALSEKVREGNFVVLEAGLEEIKTKRVVALTKALEADKKQLFVIDNLANEQELNLFLSARNIPSAVVLDTEGLGVYWLLKQEKVIVTKEALKTIEEVLG
jgi:large subunit ribosomal protein L4